MDQFEEVFALCADPAERDGFIEALLAASTAADGPRVVLAVRADFFGRCAEHGGLAEAIRDTTVLVGAMNPEELREAITRPAAAAGLTVERELTAMIIKEMAGGPGALPLMSHVMLETWRRRRGRVLTVSAYEAAGGIHGSIARTSETLYADLSPAQREQVRHLLLRLVTPGEDAPDTKRSAGRAELLVGDDADALLDRLATARLITLAEDRVELAHEALLTAWPRLRAWIDEDRQRILLQRGLTQAAQAWEEHGRDPGGLYRGLRLSMACEQFGGPGGRDDLTPLEREFLTAGIAARDRERRHRRRRSTTISALLVLTLVTALLAWQENRAGQNRQRESEARRVAGISASLRDSHPLMAMRLSLAAWRLADLPETRSALLAAAAQRPQDVFTDPDGDPQTIRHLSEDGRSLVSVGAAQVTVWDLDTGRRTSTWPAPGAAHARLGVPGGDGRKLPMRVNDDEVSLWDLAAGRPDPEVLGKADSGFELGVSGRSVIGYHADGPRYAIRVWDVRTGRELVKVDTRRRASAAMQSVTWEFSTSFARSMDNRRAWEDPAHPDVTLSPDDTLMTVCVPGEPLQLWDVAAGRRIDTPWAPVATPRQCQYEQVRFTPDSRHVVVTGLNEIRMWEVASGEKLPVIHLQGVQEIGFSADGSFLVASDRNDVLMWRIPNPGSPVFRHSLSGEYASDLRVDLRANRVRYLGGSNMSWPATVRTLDLGLSTTGAWRTPGASTAVFSPDGTTIARAYTDERRDVIQVELQDRRTGRRTAGPWETACHDALRCTTLLAFSSDGRTLGFGATSFGGDAPSSRLSLLDVAAASVSDTFSFEEKGMRSVGTVAFTPGDRSLLIASPPTVGSMTLWDPRRRAAVRTLPEVVAHHLAMHPDGRSLVTSEGDVVRFPELERASKGRILGQNSAAAFSPDGRHLATGDDTGRTTLWDGRVERRLGVLTTPGAPSAAGPGARRTVTALAFSPDGGVLAAGTSNGVVQLWDVATHQPIGGPLPTPGDSVLALTFGADGRTLNVAGEHVPVQSYDLSPQAAAATLCRRAGDGLSPADWAAYFPGRSRLSACPS
ncbi:hypothetical protein HII36_36885 [Nonomuraea sp. NN258]|nr:hypothetical protein [Nonomuraea antri]